MKLRQSLWVLLSSVLLLFSGCDHPASWGGTAPQESQEPDYVSFFGADSVHDIYIELEEEDWQEILEDPEAKEYKIANVTIDGTTIETVGVRTKGNSSIRMTNRNDSDRFPCLLYTSMPISAMLMCVFVGHVWGTDALMQELVIGSPSAIKLKKVLSVILKYIAPILILVILITGLLPA